MEKIKIEAQAREKAGVKGELSKLRAQKRIPATVYGAGKEPVSIYFAEKDLISAQKLGGNSIVDLILPNGTDQVIIKEVQYHVVKDTPIHVDFQRIKMDEEIETTVHLELTGEAPVVKTHGAIIDHVLREIAIRCLPQNMPQHILVDISGLGLENSITVADIVPPAGVTFIGEPTRMVVHAIIPREEAAPAPAAAAATDAAAAQPELSAAKGKKEEEGEAKK